MSMNVRTLAVLVAAVLLGACGSDGADAEGGTDALTRDLLAEPVGDGRSTPVAVDPSLADTTAPRVSVSRIGFNRGRTEAPVKVVELSDYGCGYCRQFHQETFPTLLSDFIETGMVEWKFMPFVTGMFDNSLAVTEAAECVYVQDEEAFEVLSRRLWDEQAAWKGSDEPGVVVRDWVSELGVDVGAYDTCLAEDERLGRVASATTLAQQLGVRGTPTFVILGYPPLQGALPLEMFQEVLTAVHDQAVSGDGDTDDSGEAPRGAGGDSR